MSLYFWFQMLNLLTHLQRIRSVGTLSLCSANLKLLVLTLSQPTSLSAIMLLIGIAYTCCCMIGEFFNSHIKQIKTKSLISNDGTTKEQRLQYSKFKVGFDLLKNFINNRLFAGVTAAQLLHKILDYDPNNLPNINRRSKIFKLIQTF